VHRAAMPQLLQKSPFTMSDVSLVQGFDCGDEPWEIEVSNWIQDRGEQPVSYGLHHGCEVWLYWTAENGLIGYGSLVERSWKWPIPISTIPFLGIQKQFWGQAGGEGETKYSHQILADLTATARSYTDRKPLLGLHVNRYNVRAIRLYESLGFRFLDKNDHPEKVNRRMIVSL